MASAVPQEKDVVVIGAGPGGYVCAIRLAQLGHQVTIIEAEAVGGVCLNWGCIPSKALIQAAGLFEKLQHVNTMGIVVESATLDMPQLMRWKDGVVQKLTQGIEQLFKRHQIELVRGRATFESATTLNVESASGPALVFKPKHVVIATGSQPVSIPGLDIDHEWMIDSTDALALQLPPKHLVLIGGGVIGLELGVMYAKLGSQVTVVELQNQLLPGVDPDIAKALARSLKKRGLNLNLESKVTGHQQQGATGTLTLATPKGEVTVTDVDKVLVAIGRKPNTAGLGLEKAGIKTTEKGFIQVDNTMRTSQPHIFAIGDVTAPPLLAHKASKEGLTVAAIINGQPEVVDYKAMPSAVFTDPEIATVGLTEAQAQAQGKTVKVGQFPFAASGRALAMGETEGFVKVIADATTDELLGVHMMGPHVSELIAEAALAIEMGACAEDLALTVHAHPTLPESLMEAAEAVHEHAIHIYQAPLNAASAGTKSSGSSSRSSATSLSGR